jgi:hypothetical protein
MSDSNGNTLIPRGPHELKRWSDGLIRRGLNESIKYGSAENLSPTNSVKTARFNQLEISSTQIDPTGNAIIHSVISTREEMLNNPGILDIIAGIGDEYYRAGVTNKTQWHASMHAHLDKIAEGLGNDLEPLFPMTWYSVTGDEEGYEGGIGGVYGSTGQHPKNYKPDYGLRLLRDGVTPEVDQIYTDFRFGSLTVLGRGQYSTMVEILYAGEVHALSLDFGQAQLDKILLRTSSELRMFIKTQIARDPATPRTIDFEGEIYFGVRTRLGEPQKVEKEVFVPLIAQEILELGKH